MPHTRPARAASKARVINLDMVSLFFPAPDGDWWDLRGRACHLLKRITAGGKARWTLLDRFASLPVFGYPFSPAINACLEVIILFHDDFCGFVYSGDFLDNKPLSTNWEIYFYREHFYTPCV